MSPMLIQFLTDWLKWAEADAQNEHVFRKFSGLCASLFDWCYEGDKEEYCEILAMELKNIFIDEFGNAANYPFGRVAYAERFGNDTQHQDPNRLAWVRKKLGEN